MLCHLAIRRRPAVVGLILLLAACGGGGGGNDSDWSHESPSSLGGMWSWTIQPFTFESAEKAQAGIPSGLLTGAQSFELSDDGGTVTANFTDSYGSDVSLHGTYNRPRYVGTMKIVTTTGRRLTGWFRLLATLRKDGRRLLDGPIDLIEDSGGLCPSGPAVVWMMSDTGGSTVEDVFQQCGPVDVVIMMDTSGSMDDEAEALCEQIESVLANMMALGLADIRLFQWGITEDSNTPGLAEDGFTCLTDNVRDLFDDPIVPGTVDRRLDLGDSDEDWGHGTAIVSELGSGGQSSNFQWRPNAIHVLIPISDEGPDDGDPPDTPEDDFAISNAISFAVANDVIVSPIIGSGAEPATSQHARDLAAGTGGIAVRSTDPDLDLGQLVFDIVFVACGGTIEPDPPPPSPGPTVLVAAGRSGGIYGLDAGTGEDTLLAPTPISGLLEDLTFVSSMVFNEATGLLLAGTGSGAPCESCVFTIGSTGTATQIADNSDETSAHPSLTQRRSDGSIFGMESDDDLLSVNGMTGFAVEFADDIGSIAEIGNALTFVGESLYLASGTELWMLDTFTGATSLVAPLTLSGFPAGEITSYAIASMTTRPSDGAVFAILQDLSAGLVRTFLCAIDVSDGTVTNVGENEELLDGIAWVPAGYFQQLAE